MFLFHFLLNCNFKCSLNSLMVPFVWLMECFCSSVCFGKRLWKRPEGSGSGVKGIMSVIVKWGKHNQTPHSQWWSLINVIVLQATGWQCILEKGNISSNYCGDTMEENSQCNFNLFFKCCCAVESDEFLMRYYIFLEKQTKIKIMFVDSQWFLFLLKTLQYLFLGW